LPEDKTKIVPEGVKCFDGIPTITKGEKDSVDCGFHNLTVESITASKASVKEVTVKP